MRVSIFFVIAAILGFSACSSTKYEPAKESVSSNGKTVTVSLRSNPTTGFSWECAIQNPEVAKVTSDSYKQDKTPRGMLGVGGIQTFVLNCVGEGRTEITFTYRRPWEGGDTAQVRNAVLSVDKNLRGTLDFVTD